MRVNLLGPLSIVYGGRKYGVDSVRVRALLALLAMSPGTAVSHDRIAAELWPGRQLGNTKNALQANVLRLRKLIHAVTGSRGDELVRTMSSGYLFDVPAEAVDCHRFAALSERGSALVETDPRLAIDLLGQALALWHGQALSDVGEGPVSRLDAEWLEELRLSAREDLISAKLRIGADRGVVYELKKLATEHPERERLHEQLMLVLYRTGRQTEALDVFHQVRKRLTTELGLEPGQGMSDLYRSILVHDQVLR